MTKTLQIIKRTVASSGTGKNGKTWTKYKYETSEGTFYMFDFLEENKEYTIESYASKGSDGKEYTNWGLPKPKNQNAQTLEEVYKLVKWLVKNHPNYMPPSEKSDKPLPY